MSSCFLSPTALETLRREARPANSETPAFNLGGFAVYEQKEQKAACYIIKDAKLGKAYASGEVTEEQLAELLKGL